MLPSPPPAMLPELLLRSATGWLVGATSPRAAVVLPAAVGAATHQNQATIVKERKEFC
jgi:hypothetical protein